MKDTWGIDHHRKGGRRVTGRKTGREAELYKGREIRKWFDLGRGGGGCKVLQVSSLNSWENRFTASYLPPVDWSGGNPHYTSCLSGCVCGLDTTDPREIIGCTPSITATHLPPAPLHQSALSAEFVASPVCFGLSIRPLFPSSLHLLNNISDTRT